jgi:hypothetical protein
MAQGDREVFLTTSASSLRIVEQPETLASNTEPLGRDRVSSASFGVQVD